MHEHILKAVLSQGGSALGRFVRWWLLALVAVGMAYGGMVIAGGHPFSIAVYLGVFVAVISAIPVAVLVAIAFIAIRF